DDDLLPIRDDIDWLAELGVITGCGEKSFCPDQVVSRGQLASLLHRALGLPYVGRNVFTDDAGSVHEAAIDAVAEAGIMGGCDPKRFCPALPATREVLRSALVAARTHSSAEEFEPTADLAKAAPICPTARHCQKKSLTRTFAAAAISAFLREGHP